MSEEEILERLRRWREAHPSGTVKEAAEAMRRTYTDTEFEWVLTWNLDALSRADAARDLVATRGYTARAHVDGHEGLAQIAGDPTFSSIEVRVFHDGLIDVSLRDSGMTVLRTLGDRVIIYQRGDWERELMPKSRREQVD